tara:strand:+ start:498 stop:758 length:261 start_codon:yes stop_codon:yes gene_type:complete
MLVVEVDTLSTNQILQQRQLMEFRFQEDKVDLVVVEVKDLETLEILLVEQIVVLAELVLLAVELVPLVSSLLLIQQHKYLKKCQYS